jgi:hypothetical protein
MEEAKSNVGTYVQLINTESRVDSSLMVSLCSDCNERLTNLVSWLHSVSQLIRAMRFSPEEQGDRTERGRCSLMATRLRARCGSPTHFDQNNNNKREEHGRIEENVASCIA